MNHAVQLCQVAVSKCEVTVSIIHKNKYFCKIESLRKRNKRVLFDYFYLYRRNKHKQKCMITFTVDGDDRFLKMHLVNEIRNYFNYLIRNTRNNEIKYFSNIELGRDFSNPHLHIQLFYDNPAQILGIYDKVVEKFGLDPARCVISEPETESDYSYVVKEYMDYSTQTLIDTDEARREYRNALGSNLRFVSQSSGMYSKEVYKRLFRRGIDREAVDDLAGDVIDLEGNIISDVFFMAVVRVLVQVLNKRVSHAPDCYFWRVSWWYELEFFEWWVFGMPDCAIFEEQNQIKEISMFRFLKKTMIVARPPPEWWAVLGSNQRPPRYERGALTN